VIVCLRTINVPPAERHRYLEWIAEGRAVREAHGILAELVLEPPDPDSDGDTMVLTVWPSHEVFDAWIATPERDASPTPTSTGPSTTAPPPATRSPAGTSVAGEPSRGPSAFRTARARESGRRRTGFPLRIGYRPGDRLRDGGELGVDPGAARVRERMS
jgi:heme-degrading monooxygenase HmoA